MSETENVSTTTATFVPVPSGTCLCGSPTFALDGMCDLCFEEAEEALAIMLSDLDNEDWHMVGDSDGGDPREWDDAPF